MSIKLRIKDCIDNHKVYVEQMAAYSDEELYSRLDIIHQQMYLADTTNNEDSMQLLDIWRSQLIEARIYKAENSIPDAQNPIELAIADIETTVAKSEEREITLNDEEVLRRNLKTKIEKNNSDQMSLF